MKIKCEPIIYCCEVYQALVVEVPELAGCEADSETYRKTVGSAD